MWARNESFTFHHMLWLIQSCTCDLFSIRDSRSTGFDCASRRSFFLFYKTYNSKLHMDADKHGKCVLLWWWWCHFWCVEIVSLETTIVALRVACNISERTRVIARWGALQRNAIGTNSENESERVSCSSSSPVSLTRMINQFAMAVDVRGYIPSAKNSQQTGKRKGVSWLFFFLPLVRVRPIAIQHNPPCFHTNAHATTSILRWSEICFVVLHAATFLNK